MTAENTAVFWYFRIFIGIVVSSVAVNKNKII